RDWSSDVCSCDLGLGLAELGGDIFDPVTNLRLGMRRLKEAWGGDLLGTWGHGHGYDAGGVLPPGVTVAVNDTDKDEYVLTHDHMVSLLRFLQDLGIDDPQAVLDGGVTAVDDAVFGGAGRLALDEGGLALAGSSGVADDGSRIASPLEIGSQIGADALAEMGNDLGGMIGLGNLFSAPQL